MNHIIFKCLPGLLILLAPIFSQAQSFEKEILSNPYISCKDVNYNAIEIIDRLYRVGEIDSIYQFLEYWESKCGPDEPKSRLKMILDISEGKFTDQDIDQQLLNFMISYNAEYTSYRYLKQTYYQSYHTGSFYHLNNWGQSLDKRSYNRLTKQIAALSSSENFDALLILDFYSQDVPSFEEIKAAPEDSKIKQLYNKEYEEVKNEIELHTAFEIGLVQYRSNTALFGSRPSFGLILGVKKLRHNLDLVLSVRAGRSKEDYTFVYEGSQITHRKWTGGYIGLEYTYDIIQKDNWSIGLSPGIAYDGVTALNVDNDYGEDSKELPSLNLNTGLVIKYQFRPGGFYMGLHMRYNWVDYNNPGGTDLNGEYINFRFTIGNIFNGYRSNRLNYME